MTMRHFAVHAGVLAMLAAGGCATASIEDAVPVGALEQPAPEPAFARPGDYPNLNVNPEPATEQFTDAERRQEAAALRARRTDSARAEAGRGVADQSADLRRLARSHADDALREIEGE